MRISQTSQFRKDVKKQVKRGKDPEKITEVLHCLLRGEPLPERYKDHPLKGKWTDARDCQLEPDWILIYRVNKEEVRLERTGTHSDLF